ncbi:MAG: hypothetical protein II958_04050 [Spirochaetia bacterium]|nr:hypothetical protein [Spirochaetia bacterium]
MKKLILVLLVLCLFACSRKTDVELEKKSMFTLPYGVLDDELTPLAVSKVAMNDGFFYIIDSSLAKMMKFNSYGDLLMLQYNQDKNPTQILVHKNGDDTPSNKAAMPFPYIEPTQIAVANDQAFYVADTLPEMETVWSDTYSCMLTSTVHCFDPHGKLICDLGQEGRAGATPFSRITRIEATDSKHLVVHTQTPKGQVIYWFDDNYTLLHTILADTSILPQKEIDNHIVEIDTLAASKAEPMLFIKTDYYTENNDDIEFYKSSIFCYDIALEKCIWSMDIPMAESLYQLMGVYGKEQIYLVSPVDDDTYNLLILDGANNIAVNTPLALGDKDIQLLELSLGSHGIITALISYEDEVSAVWWRSDKLLKEEK